MGKDYSQKLKLKSIKNISINVPTPIYIKMKEKASSEGFSIKDALRGLIYSYLLEDDLNETK